MLKKKIWADFDRIIELFTQKILSKVSNMGLGSEIRDPEKAYSGSRIRNTGLTCERGKYPSNVRF
jgi:hypothetical protein